MTFWSVKQSCRHYCLVFFFHLLYSAFKMHLKHISCFDLHFSADGLTHRWSHHYWWVNKNAPYFSQSVSARAPFMPTMTTSMEVGEFKYISIQRINTCAHKHTHAPMYVCMLMCAEVRVYFCLFACLFCAFTLCWCAMLRIFQMFEYICTRVNMYLRTKFNWLLWYTSVRFGYWVMCAAKSKPNSQFAKQTKENCLQYQNLWQ